MKRKYRVIELSLFMDAAGRVAHARVLRWPDRHNIQAEIKATGSMIDELAHAYRSGAVLELDDSLMPLEARGQLLFLEDQGAQA